MLYTPVAMEDIYPTDAVLTDMREYQVNGRIVIARRDRQDQWRLERLVSTDPQDYLDPQYQPQNLIFM